MWTKEQPMAPSLTRIRDLELLMSSWQEHFLEKLVAAVHATSDDRLATATLHLRKSEPFIHLQTAFGGGNPGPSFLQSHEELATLFHPPTASVHAERLQTTAFTELEPPAKFRSGEEPGAVTLGRVRFRNDERLVGIAAPGSDESAQLHGLRATPN